MFNFLDKPCDLSSTRIEVPPTPPPSADHKPRAMHKDFESFMKTARTSTPSLDENQARAKPKYVCLPAGYTPSTLPTREARFRSDKLYAESISFR